MAYKGTDEKGEQFTGGEPSPEEEDHGKDPDEANGEYDPEKHPDNYIYRM